MLSGKHNPIFIYAIARSGSSLVTSIFADHGIHLGEIQGENRFGYKTYENRTIADSIASISVTDHLRGCVYREGCDQSDARGVFDSMMPHDKRWAYKTNVECFGLFDGICEGARHVFVLRNPDSVIKSNVAKRGARCGSDSEYTLVTEGIVSAWTDYIEELRDRFPIVMSEDVIAGDYDSLRKAFDYCGMDFRDDLACKTVDHKKWNY